MSWVRLFILKTQSVKDKGDKIVVGVFYEMVYRRFDDLAFRYCHMFAQFANDLGLYMEAWMG